MKKVLKILALLVVGCVIGIVFKSPILLSIMKAVDFIGMQLNLNVVNVIDFLNVLYYM